MTPPRKPRSVTWLLTVAAGACAETEHDAPQPTGMVVAPGDAGPPGLDAGIIVQPPVGLPAFPPDAGQWFGSPPIPPDASVPSPDAGPGDAGPKPDASTDAGCTPDPLAPILGLILGDAGARSCEPGDGGP